MQYFVLVSVLISKYSMYCGRYGDGRGHRMDITTTTTTWCVVLWRVVGFLTETPISPFLVDRNRLYEVPL